MHQIVKAHPAMKLIRHLGLPSLARKERKTREASLEKTVLQKKGEIVNRPRRRARGM